MSYLSPEYNRNEQTRAVQSCWHDAVLALANAERIFRSIGHRKEADQMFSYTNTLAQHAEYHLKRLVQQNGHNKDSHPDVAHGSASDDNSPALADETCASVGDGHDQPSMSPHADDVTVATSLPISGVVRKQFDLSLVEEIELWMTQVRAMNMPGSQLKECALSFGCRALDLARRGHVTAGERFAAAKHVLHGGQETGT